MTDPQEQKPGGKYTKYRVFPENKIEPWKKHIQVRSEVDANGCWIWKGAINQSGYGSARFLGESINAHRASYMAFNGEIPGNHFVCHRCDVKQCVNPEHLFTGTHIDNMRDAYEKGRIKLAFTDDQVNAIKSLHEQGYGSSELGKMYGVDHESIRNVVLGKTYKTVPREDIRWEGTKPFSIMGGPVLANS